VVESRKLVPCVEQPALEACLVKVSALVLVKCVVYCYSYRLEILLFILKISYLVTCFSFAVPGVSNLNAVTDGHRRNMFSRCFLRQKLDIRVVT